MNHFLRVFGAIFAFALLPLSETQSFAAESEQKYLTVLEQKSYTVEYGDTLSGIALRFKSSVDELMTKGLNPRLAERGNPDLIYAGERISLPYFQTTIVPQKDVQKEISIVISLDALEEMLSRTKELAETKKLFLEWETVLINRLDSKEVEIDAVRAINNSLEAVLKATQEKLSRAETLLGEIKKERTEKDVASTNLVSMLSRAYEESNVILEENYTLRDVNSALVVQVKELEATVENLKASVNQVSGNAKKEKTFSAFLLVMIFLLVLIILAVYPYKKRGGKNNNTSGGGGGIVKNAEQNGNATANSMKSASADSPVAPPRNHSGERDGAGKVATVLLRQMTPDKAIEVVRHSLTGETLLALSETPLARDPRNNPIKLGNIARTIEKHPELKGRVPSEWDPKFFEAESVPL